MCVSEYPWSKRCSLASWHRACASPLVPQPTRPPSPRQVPAEDNGSALIRAQREEYRAAETADRQRQQQQSDPGSTDSDALRAAARTRRREHAATRTETQEETEAEQAETGRLISADVAGQREREPQRLGAEQMRRARIEHFEGALESCD